MRPVLALPSLLALLLNPACGAAPGTSPATPSPAPAATGGAFEGCTGVFTAVLGWNFTCERTSVVTREGDDVEALLRGARESMRGAFAGPVEEQRQEVTVAGAARKGMALSLRSASKQVVAIGTAALLEGAGHPARVVACLANADEAAQARCHRQLDELGAIPYAELPPPAVVLRPRPAPAIAERAITAPADCHLAANDRSGLLDCGDTILGWSEPSDPHAVASEKDATIEDTARKMKLGTTGAAPPKKTTGACHIEGVAASCSVVRWPEVTLTVGSAVVRGHTILAWCVARDGSTSRICTDVVTTHRGGRDGDAATGTVDQGPR